MIEELIKKLEIYIDELKQSMALSEKKLEQYEKMLILISNKESILKEDLNSLCEDVSFSEEEKNKLYFIFNVLFKIESDIELDDSQEKVYNKLKESIIIKIEDLKTETDKSIIYKINQLIVELKSDKVFTKFDELNELLKKIELPINDRLEIVKLLIIDNYSKISSDEEELIVYNNDEDSIIKLFNIYGLDFSLLKKEFKDMFIKYADLNNVEDMLKMLTNIDATFLQSLMKKNQELFSRILIGSNTTIVDRVLEASEKGGINPIDSINSFPSILIGGRKRGPKLLIKGSKKGTNEHLNSYHSNYVNNINFFTKEGINTSVLYEKCRSLLVRSSDSVKSNYRLFKDLYGFPMSESDTLFPLVNGNSIDNLDRLIEVSSLGYEYAIKNRSILFNGSNLLLYKLKIKELYNIDEEVKNNVISSGMYLYPSEPIIYTENGQLKKSRKFSNDGPTEIDDAKRILGIKEHKESVDYDIITISMLHNITSIDVEDLLSNEYILELEQNCKNNEYAYEINNVRISRIKFLRICTLFKMNDSELTPSFIKYALTYNSILNENELERINEFVNSLSSSRNGGNK